MTDRELDARVFDLVRARGPIENHALQALLDVPSSGGRAPELDRALQRLHKAQRIAASCVGWTPTNAHPCSRCKGTGEEPLR